jgi:transforming growth factor-beta-induced protein
MITNLISHATRKAKTILALTVFLTAAVACDDEETTQSNIVQLAQSNANLSTLVTALTKFPDLVTTLSGNGNFTVFAPTNAAFADLLEDLDATSLNDVDEAELKNILEYHVITTAALEAADLESQGYNTAENKQLFVSVGSTSVKINGVVTVTTPNVAASNGIVHIVDKVIVPPTQTIAQIATSFNPNEFTQLVAALARTSGRNPDLLAAVSNPGTLTVFAPTDAAFQQLYTALEVEGINDIDINVLTSVLRHHVITSRKYSSDLTNGALSTLNGDDVTINLANLTVTGASGGTNVANLQPTLLNVNGTNGVIHVINRVLLPDLD